MVDTHDRNHSDWTEGISMTLRNALEAVLRKHGTAFLCRCLGLEECKMLTDDLLACYPQPSLGELVTILSQRIGKEWLLENGSIHPIVVGTISNEIMVWARGETPKKDLGKAPLDAEPPAMDVKFLPQHNVCMHCHHCINCAQCAPRPTA